MKHWQVFLIYLAAFILQPFLQNLVPLVGGNLNLILCLTVMFVFVHEEPGQGIFFGCIFAMLWDLFYGQYTGPGALALVLCATVVFLCKYFAHTENFLNAILFMAVATWLYMSIYWGIYAAIGSPYSYSYAMGSLLLQVVFNCIVGLGVYFVLMRRVIKHRRDRYYR